MAEKIAGEGMMRILLVDDNALQASTREAILTRCGLDVVVAPDGAEALRMLQDPSIGPSIGLMVTDHLMPGMNGCELARAVRLRAKDHDAGELLVPDLPILVLSGMPDADAEYAGLDVAFHLKPFPPLDFIRVVKTMLNRQRLRSA